MSVSVASFNVEKTGQASDMGKQTVVSHFLDECVRSNIQIIFFCEVHSSRTNDYISYIKNVYPNYNVMSFWGGKSNNYVLMWTKAISFEISYYQLKGLDRPFVLIYTLKDNMLCEGVLLAHFKSGQTGLTKSQLTNAANNLAEIFPNGQWAIMGDMNWDKRNVGEVVKGLTSGILVQSYTCWGDLMTQKSGGILDWCLASTSVRVVPADLVPYKDDYNMSGPDHRPIIFNLF